MNDRDLLQQAFDALKAYMDYIPDNTVQGEKDAALAEKVINALSTRLAQPVAQGAQPEHCGPSSAVYDLAAMVMSDCGHSTNNQRLLARIAERITRYIDSNAPQPEQELVVWRENIKQLADQYASECVEFARGIPTGAGSMSPIAVKAGDTRLALHTTIDCARPQPDRVALTDEQDSALNKICELIHRGEEIEADDGLAMMVPMDLWNEACEAVEALVGQDQDEDQATIEAAHGIKGE